MPVKQSPLYNRKEYGSKNSNGVIFFGCPYGTRANAVIWAIRQLTKSGYIVVSYDFHNDVVSGRDLGLLPQVVTQLTQDIHSSIEKFKANTSNFGVFGSSLGSFILFGIVADIPELRWGIFNTAGNAAEAAWNVRSVRRKLTRYKYTVDDVSHAWKQVQEAKFKKSPLYRRFLFIGSKNDNVLPLKNITHYLANMRQAGISFEIREYSKSNHIFAVLKGLVHTRKLVSEVDLKA